MDYCCQCKHTHCCTKNAMWFEWQITKHFGFHVDLHLALSTFNSIHFIHKFVWFIIIIIIITKQKILQICIFNDKLTCGRSASNNTDIKLHWYNTYFTVQYGNGNLQFSESDVDWSDRFSSVTNTSDWFKPVTSIFFNHLFKESAHSDLTGCAICWSNKKRTGFQELFIRESDYISCVIWLLMCIQLARTTL